MKKPLIAAAAAAAVIAAGSLGAVTRAQAETPSPTPSAPVTAKPSTPSGTPSEHARPAHPGKGQGRGMGPGEMQMLRGASQELAAKLGVTEEALKTAGQTVAQQLRAQYEAAGTKPSIDQMQKDFASGLAKQLNLPEEKVQQALSEIRAAHQAEADAAIKARLDQAVKDGKLTQAEADAVAKAIANGVVPGGFGHGHR